MAHGKKLHTLLIHCTVSIMHLRQTYVHTQAFVAYMGEDQVV